MPEYVIPLGKSITLSQELEAGKQLTFISSSVDLSVVPDLRLPVDPVPPNPDSELVWFSLDNNVGDVLFRFFIVHRRNTIAFNTKYRNGNWMDDKRVDFPDVHRAFDPDTKDAKVVIQNTEKCYRVFVNGNYLGTWGKFIGGDPVTISYGADAGAPKIFSPTVKVLEE